MTATTLCLATSSLAKADVDDCEITMRWDDDPPYSMARQGELIGIDADLAREAMDRMGCKILFRKLPWARALKELSDGRIDLVSGAYRTSDREAYAHYSSVVGMTSPNILFIRKEDKTAFNFDDLEALLKSGFQLGAQIGVSYSQEYSRLIEDPKLKENIEFLSQRRSLWRMLAVDRLEGVIASQLTAIFEIQELGLSDVITSSSLIVSDKPAYFIFSKASVSSEFVADFDRTLRAMLDDGTYADIVSRYVCLPDGFEWPTADHAPHRCQPQSQASL